MIKLFKHQEELVKQDPKKCGIFWGTGGGKSATALSLAVGNTLVICPKTLRDDKTWERNLEKLGKQLSLTVVSKEDFKRDFDKLPYFDTIIADECHLLCGINPVLRWRNKKPEPKTSQIFDAFSWFVKYKSPKRLYLLTATPIRNPMSVYALGIFLNRDWDFHKFRSVYYVPIKMGNKEIWMPKKDKETQERLGKCVRGLGYTGQLSDWLDVPDQTHIVKHVPLTVEQLSKLKELPLEFPDPLVLVGKKHQVEQGVLKGNEFEPSQTFPTGKLEAIEDLHEEFGKVLIFAKYTEQIDLIKDHFKGKEVYTLTGQTKNREEVIKNAEASSNCILIAQSTVSAGWEFPSCRCTIYASESYSVVDYAQSLGRTLRLNNLQKNLYVYLISGDVDRAVRKALDLKTDFSEAIYSKEI